MARSGEGPANWLHIPRQSARISRMATGPYHKWLGIVPDQQPASHYRLLAIEEFESDADVIDGAAEEQIRCHVQLGRKHGIQAFLEGRSI